MSQTGKCACLGHLKFTSRGDHGQGDLFLSVPYTHQNEKTADAQRVGKGELVGRGGEGALYFQCWCI